MKRAAFSLFLFLLISTLIACSVKTSSEGTAAGSGAGAQPSTENPLVTGGGTGAPADETDTATPGSGTDQTGTVTPPPTPPEEPKPVEITTTELDVRYQGLDHKQKLYGKGGSGQFEWSAAGLPAGLKLQAGLIQGKTDAVGDAQVTITLKDKVGAAQAPPRTLTLSVKPWLQEEIAIKVSRGVPIPVPIPGTQHTEIVESWFPVEQKPAGKIPNIALEPAMRRIKLEIVKKGTDTPASAPRYFWSVRSPNNTFGAFAPPATEGQQPQQQGAQTVFIMPWAESGDVEVAQGLLAGETFANVDVAVTDEFGNTAAVAFDEISFAMTQQQECTKARKNAGPLELIAPDNLTRDYNSVKNEGVGYDIQMQAKGGLPPYQWDSGWADFTWSKTLKKQCFDPQKSTCTYHISDIDIVNYPAPTEEPSDVVPLMVTDACGNTAEKTVTLVAQWPTDDLSEMVVTFKAKDACDTDESTWIVFRLFAKGELLGEAKYWLDDIDCDDDLGWYHAALDTSAGDLPPNVIDQINVKTTDSCDGSWSCGEVDIDVYTVWFQTPHWQARWDDESHDDLLNDDEGAQEFEITRDMDFFSPDDRTAIWHRRFLK